MIEETDSRRATPPTPPLRRRLRTCLGGLLLILVGVGGLLLWFGWRPKLPANPVHLTRTDNGRLAPAADDSRPSGLHLELNAATIRASSQTATTASESRPSGARFACQRLTIVNRSDHLLMARVGAALLQQLDNLRGFDEVGYFPFGARPSPGVRAPDMTVLLSLAEIKTSGLPGSRGLDAQIAMVASSSPYDYPSHHFDGFDAPLVQLSVRTTLHHQSTTTGIGTPSSRFKLASEDIAKSLGKALVKKLNDIYEQDGPLPALPDQFYPRYTQPPKLPLPTAARPQLIASYHGLMKANESLWKWETTQLLPDVLTGFQQRLKEAGWKTNSLQTAPNALPLLRMLRDEDIVVIYPERRERSEGPAAPDSRRPTAESPPQKPTGRVMFAYFADRMSRDDRTKALNALVGSDPSIDTLLMLESMMERPLRERFFERIESESPASPKAWLRLAQWHQGAKRPEQAKQALRRAHLLLRTAAEDTKVRQQVDDLAKKLGQPLPKQGVPAAGDLESLGFVKLTPAAAFERDLAVNQGALFYAQVGDRLTTFLIRVVRQQGGERPLFGLYHKEATNGSRSWGTGPLDHSSHIDHLGHVQFHAAQIGNTARFKLSVELTEAP